jgi:hypothetical protein
MTFRSLTGFEWKGNILESGGGINRIIGGRLRVYGVRLVGKAHRAESRELEKISGLRDEC